MEAPELRVLRYFVAVAEELHFGRAARRLHIAQPSLSIQIRKLERHFQVQLLERDSRGVALTHAGEILLGEAKVLLARADRLVESVARCTPRERLVVGFQANAAAELTPRIMEMFRRLRPGVDVVVRSYDLTDPFVGLSDGGSDVAFVRIPLPQRDWLATETLFTEPRVVGFSDNSPLAAFESVVPFDALVELPFVVRKAPSFWRDYWLGTDHRDSVPLRVGAEISTLEECFEAVSLGRAVAFTQASTERFFGRPGVSYRAVAGLAPSSLAVGWRNDNFSDSVAAFVDTARCVADDAPPVDRLLVP